jgi:raffinose/stachyose/melibiose transport system substrate-binding protein
MKRNNALRFFGCALIVLLLSFTGCAKGASSGKVVLNVWHAQTDPTVQKYLQAYEETHPNVTVKQTVMVDDDFKTQSRVALSAGTAPDVWYTNTGSSLEQFVKAGGLMDLSKAIKDKGWAKRYDATALDCMSLKGKVYGLPWSLYTPWMVLWANKDWFEAHKLAYPKTVDELIELAPKIRALGQEPLVFYNKDGWTGAILFGEYVLQQAGPEWLDKINSGKLKWTDSVEARKALETMQKLSKANVFLTGYATQRQDTALPVWKNKKSPLMYNGTWFTQNIGRDFDFKVDCIQLPLLDEDSTPKAYQNWVDWCIGVNPKSKVKDVAIDFVGYAAGDEFFKIIGNQQGNLTPDVAANESVAVPYYFKTPPILDQLSKPKTPFFCYGFPMSVVTVLQDQIKLVLAGQSSVDEALAAIQAEQERKK